MTLNPSVFTRSKNNFITALIWILWIKFAISSTPFSARHVSTENIPSTSWRNCSLTMFTCRAGKKDCVSLDWWCDGDADCDDGSDEDNCETKVCKESHFECGEPGDCIATGWLCDGDQDCQNGMDEAPDLCDSNPTCRYYGAACVSQPTLCVTYDKLCNGIVDCPDDGSDEKFCQEKAPGYNGPSQCAVLNCTYQCAILPSGAASCYCADGFVINDSDNRTCSAVSACSVVNPCEQLCTDGVGWNVTCSCHPGFLVDPADPHLCFIPPSDHDQPYLLVSSNENLLKVSLDGSQKVLYTSKTGAKIPAIDFDWSNNLLCWISVTSNPSLSTFSCSDIKELRSAKKLPLPYSVHNVHQFLIDWLTGNVYFADSRDGRIFACNITGQPVCRTVHQLNSSDHLHGIAIDPLSGLLFYTDHGVSPRLSRVGMDGGSLGVVVNRSIVFPEVLTLDIYGKRIYFIDTHQDYIESVGYNGRHRKMVLQSKNKLFFTDIAYFNGSIFATDFHNKSIVRIPAWSSSGQNSQVVVRGLKYIYVIKLAHKHLHNEADLQHGCKNKGCEQICLLTASDNSSPPGGVCKCQAGFTLSDDGTSCNKPEGDQLFLLYGKSNPGEIKGVSLFADRDHNYSPMIPIENLQMPRALDYYRDSDGVDWVIYSDIGTYELSRRRIAPEEGAESEIIFDMAFHDCQGVAVDWMSGNVYWTDDGYGTVNVARLAKERSAQSGPGRPGAAASKGDHKTSPVYLRKVLLRSNTSHLRAIAVDPAEGLMYWTQWQVARSQPGYFGSIERAWMDGSNRTSLVTPKQLDGDDILWPNGLTLDLKHRLLFWVEAYYDRIECVNLDGTNRKVIMTGNFHGVHNALSHPLSVVVYQDPSTGGRYLYWSEYRSAQIIRLDLNVALNATGGLPRSAYTTVVQENPPLLEIVVYDPASRNGSNSCSSNPCSDICLPIPAPPHYRCECPDNRRMAEDQHTCIEKENYTPPSPCAKDHFECSNGLCVPVKWLCDSDYDCLDHSDESLDRCMNSSCPSGWFKCPSSGICIAGRWVCDGDADCTSGADENPTICNNRTCSSGHFLCSSGLCIPDVWRCDGEDDCSDGSDESANCSSAACDEGVQFTCGNGKCIAVEWKCDGEDDCGDGSDELDCPDKWQGQLACMGGNQFACGNGSDECIPRRWQCDGNTDCHDGSDELNCGEVACPNSLLRCGDTGPCKILPMWICDMDVDCQNGWDESNCSCPDTGKYKQKRCLTNMHRFECVNMCDGKIECLLDDDEEGCVVNGTCADSGCSHSCSENFTLIDGYTCSCPKGMEIGDDHKTCRFIPYCEFPGTCSHICHQELSNYECSCYPGWISDPQDPTGWGCVYAKPQPPPFLIFTNHEAVRFMELDMRLGFDVHPHLKIRSQLLVAASKLIAGSVDFHYRKKLLFYSDVGGDTITRADLHYDSKGRALRTANASVVVSGGIDAPEGIAVDWLAERLYFVESSFDQIEVADLEGNHRSVLVAGGITNPRALALDPRFGLIFWTDWEESNPRIERCTMAGKSRRVIWDSRRGGGGWPNGLTVDYLENRIYWADAKSDAILSSLYDGSRYFTALTNAEWLTHPFALTLYSHLLIWSDSFSVIASAFKWPGRNSTVLELSTSDPFDIIVFHESRQPLTKGAMSNTELVNPCANHSCAGLCVISPQTLSLDVAPVLLPKCLCPYMFELGQDGLSCNRIKSFLIYARPLEIQGVSLTNLNYSTMYAISAPAVRNATRLAVDEPRDRVYWSEAGDSQIKRASLNGSEVENVIKTDSTDIYGLVVDWMREKIFWTSSEPVMRNGSVASLARITMASLVSGYKARLETRAPGSPWMTLHHPRGLTADVINALLYFACDEGVYQVNMDGSGLNKISPLDDVIDLYFLNSHLYLTHDASLHQLYNGRCQGPYWCTTNLKVKGTYLSASRSNVWIYDPTTSSIYKVSRQVGRKWVRVRQRGGLTRLNALAMYDVTKQTGFTDGTNNATVGSCTVHNGGCEQLCLPPPHNQGDVTCRCSTGFHATKANLSACEMIRDFLVYSNDHIIAGVDMESDADALVPITTQLLPTGVDFYAKNNTIVWIDTATSLIKGGSRDSTSQWVIYSHYVTQRDLGSRQTGERFEGISVDWIAGNLYWTDPGLDLIKVIRLNGSFPYTIYKGGDRIRAISVHPTSGLLFATDWGKKASIIRMRLDGSWARQIVSNLGWPNGLTVDYENDILYWCDAKSDQIQSSDIDGNNVRTVISSNQSRTYGITYFKGFLYWTDSQYLGGSVSSYDLSSNTLRWLRKLLSYRLNDIVAYSPERQLGTNLCADTNTTKNGGCEQLCFYLGGNETKCACAYGMLNTDNKTCKAFDKYVLYSSRTVIRSINVYNPHDLNEPFPLIENPKVMRSIVAMAMDYQGRRVFYSDIVRSNIYWIDMKEQGRSTPNRKPVAKDVGTVEGMAYHRGQDALYWTSFDDRQVMRLYLSHPNSTKKLIIVPPQAPEDKLRALVLWECQKPNLIFWTNWNAKQPSVMRATTNGENIVKLITTGVSTPNALTIDIVARKLYWADATLDKIERCTFDGQDRKIILSRGLDHVFSLAVLGRHLYWSDWQREKILRASKWTGGDMQVMRNLSFLNLLGVMAVYDDQCKPNPCAHTQCKYECVVLEDDTPQCMCPNGTLSFACRGDDNCGKDGFNCNVRPSVTDTPECIHYSLTCDGTRNCRNGTDEDKFYCGQRQCRKNYWLCGNRRCIHTRFLCDGTDDCGDGSDESDDIDCPQSGLPTPKLKCSEGMFRCDNGHCVPMTWKCDREDDCGDGSDERCNMTCPPLSFQCKSDRVCIPNAYQCDFDADCADGSDEQGCVGKKCKEGFMSCAANNHCIPLRWACDGQYDCPDGSDELSCGDAETTCLGGLFRCVASGKCINAEWKCDRDNDCEDGSDEDRCDYPPCKDTEFQCQGGKCVSRSWVCDGDPDCADGGDETNCTGCDVRSHVECDDKCLDLNVTCNGHNDCTNGEDESSCDVRDCDGPNRCQQICVERKYKYECKCRKGYRLAENGFSCLEINECNDPQIAPPCSQVCTNDGGAYLCSCTPGYHRNPLDTQTCQADKHTGEAYVIFTNRHYIGQVLLDSTAHNYSHDLHLYHPVALDFHWGAQLLFWADVMRGKSVIKRMEMNQSYVSQLEHLNQSRVVYESGTAANNVQGLAVDWVADNIYWTDSGAASIEVATIDGLFRKTLINTEITFPMAIVVDPKKGYMYWTDIGESPHIGSAGMDGFNRTIVINKSKFNHFHEPAGLTMDYTSGKLFWSDSRRGYIAYCNTDGTYPKIVVDIALSPHLISLFGALSVFEDRLYWFDPRSKRIVSTKKFRPRQQQAIVLTQVPYKITDLKMAHPLRQPAYGGHHPCKVYRQGCSDLCLVAPGSQGFRCECPDNFILGAGNTTCINNCSFSEFACANHKCVPQWWKCDTVDDCGDNSDEADSLDCRPFHCTPGQFQCQSSTADRPDCISPSSLCDGESECRDGSDELNCERHVCMDSQFKCSKSVPPRCILDLFRCDGSAECDEAEDEEDCPPPRCAPGEISCQRKGSPSFALECIPSSWRCDGDQECEDGSDEKNCEQAGCADEEEDACKDGSCLGLLWFCDGEKDCPDGSDETIEECGPPDLPLCTSNQWSCHNGQCVALEFRCDGENDCGDESDEINCTNSTCPSSYFTCNSSGECVPAEFRCDGENECTDGSDELDCNQQLACGKYEFRCEVPPACIPLEDRCDGIAHCLNYTEEFNCLQVPGSRPCPEFMFRCVDNTCVPLHWQCDGQFDCPDASDEGPVCDQFVCPPDRSFRCESFAACLPLSKVCDGVKDCLGDGTDEEHDSCTARPPNLGHSSDGSSCLIWRKMEPQRMDSLDGARESEGGYLCGDGSCAPLTTLCDDVITCPDVRDERFCSKDDCTVTHNCSQLIKGECRPLPPSAGGGRFKSLCTCGRGYQLDAEMRCVDVDECSTLHPCSQTCINLPGSFHCKCEKGWVNSGHTFCRLITKAGGKAPKLITTSGIPPVIHVYEYLEAEEPSRDLVVRLNTSSDIDVTRMASTPFDDVYWIDWKHASIHKWSNKQSAMIHRLAPGSRPTGIAFDWIGSNLYWSDIGTRSVHVMSLNTHGTPLSSLPLYNGNNSNIIWPLDVALSIRKGFLFVADGGSDVIKPSIIRLPMSGGDSPKPKHQLLIRCGEMDWPGSVAVDDTAARIYWADSKLRVIVSCDFNGIASSEVRRFESQIRPRSIALYGDYIFATTAMTNRVFRIHKLAHTTPSVATRKRNKGFRAYEAFFHGSSYLDADKLLSHLQWIDYSSGEPPALAIINSLPRESVALTRAAAPNNCTACDVTGALCLHSGKQYECLCPQNGTSPRGFTPIVHCSCVGVHCPLPGEVCEGGECRCPPGASCDVIKVPATGSPALPVVVVVIFVVVLALIGLWVAYKRKARLLGFRHSLMTSHNDVGNLLYSELAASEMTDLSAPLVGGSETEDANGFAAHSSDKTGGETPAATDETNTDCEITMDRDRIFYTPHGGASEHALLLEGETPEALPKDKPPEGAKPYEVPES